MRLQKFTKGHKDRKIRKVYVGEQFGEKKTWLTPAELNHPALSGLTGLHRQGIIRAIREAKSLSEAEENLRMLVFKGKGLQCLEDLHITAIKSILKQKGWT